MENNFCYENKGCKVIIQYRKDYINFILLFQYIGKYKIDIFGSYEDDINDNYLTTYHFICNTNLDYKDFFFEPEEVELQYNEILEKSECEYISHKGITFNAKDKEKIIFKFKKDSNIYVREIELFSLSNLDQNSKVKLKKQLKYITSKNGLEIDAIFNDKGIYNINILFQKNDTFSFINFYPKKIEDSKQKSFFSFEEYSIHNVFDESLKILHLNYISHKNQIINVKETETFEFESSCERFRITFKSFEENDEEDNVVCKKIYLNNSNKKRMRLILTFDMEGKYILKFTITCSCKIKEDIYYIATYDPDLPTEKISNTYNNEKEKNRSEYNKLKINEEIELYKALMSK